MIDFLVFWPVLILYKLPSLLKSMNYLRIVEGKSYDGYHDWCFIPLITVYTKTWEFRQPLLHFIFDIRSELPNLRHRICFIQILIAKLFIHFIRYAEFASVISRRYGLDIPFHKLDVLDTLDVLNTQKHEQVDPNTEATDDETEDFSRNDVFLRNLARNLHEQVGLIVALRVLTVFVDIFFQGQLA